MINDGLALARGDVLYYSRTGRFEDAAHHMCYRVLTHPVSLGRALQGGYGAAYVYVLEPVGCGEHEHLHVQSEYLRSVIGYICWRRWRADCGLVFLAPA